MAPSDTTNKIFNILNTIFNNKLPENIQSLRLFLDVDSPPKLEVDYIPNDITSYTTTKTFKITEEEND